MLTTTHYQPPLAAQHAPPGDPALAAWLDGDAGLAPEAAQPWYGAELWQLWLPRDGAARLLADLDAHAIPARLAGVIEPRGVWLYLWPLMPIPALPWLLRSYCASSTRIHADQVRGGRIWATGAALARLLRPQRATAREIGGNE